MTLFSKNTGYERKFGLLLIGIFKRYYNPHVKVTHEIGVTLLFCMYKLRQRVILATLNLKIQLMKNLTKHWQRLT